MSRRCRAPIVALLVFLSCGAGSPEANSHEAPWEARNDVLSPRSFVWHYSFAGQLPTSHEQNQGSSQTAISQSFVSGSNIAGTTLEGDNMEGFTCQDVCQYLVRTMKGAAQRLGQEISRTVGTDRFFQYIQVNTYLVVADADTLRSISRLEGVLSISMVEDMSKVSDSLRNRRNKDTDIPWQNRKHGDDRTETAHTQATRDTTPAPTRTTIFVLAAPDKGLPLDVLSEQWRTELDAAFAVGVAMGGGITAFVAGNEKVGFEIDATLRDEVVLWLSQQARVRWVEEKPVFRTRNKYSCRIVQSKGATRTTVWDQGITGQGEIVGIADTGIDYDSCFFRDADTVSHPLPTCPTAPRTGSLADADKPTCVDLNHRKIVMYRYFSGTTAYSTNVGDTAMGHGTHVSGSVAGQASSTTADDTQFPFASMYSGAAPDAKLTFDDISADGESLNGIPADTNTGLFPVSYWAGARIHSNSWGSSEASYTTNAREMDAFMYDHPDYLILVAAGNDGPADFTVGSPATAKNILSVGAGFNTKAANAEYGTAFYGLVITQPQAEVGKQLMIVKADFGVDVLTRNITASVVLCDPPLACKTLMGTYTGKIVLILRGTCDFDAKVQRAQKAGAVAVIVYNNVPGPAFTMSSNGLAITIPAVMVSNSDGLYLKQLIGTGTLQVNMPTLFNVPDIETSFTNLAYFSSQGPCQNDLRIKPDVVCPGYNIRSAASDGSTTSKQCGAFEATSGSPTGAVLLMSGTSMATPTCAGATALVRQYFREGYHASGYKNITAGFIPTASLIKAMMIHSGRPMRYEDAVTGNMVTPSRVGPNMAYGYGLVDLSSVLWFGRSSSFNISTYNNQTIQDGDMHVRCFRVLSNTVDFRASLVWTDPPGDPSASVALVHDLDLTVVDATGSFNYGNALFTSTETHGVQAVRDVVNTAEQVTLVSPNVGVVTVRVSGASVQMPQSYSLVVTGHFDQVSKGSCGVRTCARSCSGHGVCTSRGACTCDVLYTGTDCSLLIPELVNSTTFTATVSTGGWGYYRFQINNRSATFTLTFSPAAGMPANGDADFFLAQGRKPTLQDFDKSKLDSFSTGTFAVTGWPGQWIFGILSYNSSAVKIDAKVVILRDTKTPGRSSSSSSHSSSSSSSHSSSSSSSSHSSSSSSSHSSSSSSSSSCSSSSSSHSSSSSSSSSSHSSSSSSSHSSSSSSSSHSSSSSSSSHSSSSSSSHSSSSSSSSHSSSSSSSSSHSSSSSSSSSHSSSSSSSPPISPPTPLVTPSPTPAPTPSPSWSYIQTWSLTCSPATAGSSSELTFVFTFDRDVPNDSTISIALSGFKRFPSSSPIRIKSLPPTSSFSSSWSPNSQRLSLSPSVPLTAQRTYTVIINVSNALALPVAGLSARDVRLRACLQLPSVSTGQPCVRITSASEVSPMPPLITSVPRDITTATKAPDGVSGALFPANSFRADELVSVGLVIVDATATPAPSLDTDFVGDVLVIKISSGALPLEKVDVTIGVPISIVTDLSASQGAARRVSSSSSAAGGVSDARILQQFWYDQVRRTWVSLGGTFYAQNNTMTASVDPSVFASSGFSGRFMNLLVPPALALPLRDTINTTNTTNTTSSDDRATPTWAIIVVCVVGGLLLIGIFFALWRVRRLSNQQAIGAMGIAQHQQDNSITKEDTDYFNNAADIMDADMSPRAHPSGVPIAVGPASRLYAINSRHNSNPYNTISDNSIPYNTNSDNSNPYNNNSNNIDPNSIGRHTSIGANNNNNIPYNHPDNIDPHSIIGRHTSVGASSSISPARPYSYEAQQIVPPASYSSSLRTHTGEHMDEAYPIMANSGVPLVTFDGRNADVHTPRVRIGESPGHPSVSQYVRSEASHIDHNSLRILPEESTVDHNSVRVRIEPPTVNEGLQRINAGDL